MLITISLAASTLLTSLSLSAGIGALVGVWLSRTRAPHATAANSSSLPGGSHQESGASLEPAADEFSLHARHCLTAVRAAIALADSSPEAIAHNALSAASTERASGWNGRPPSPSTMQSSALSRLPLKNSSNSPSKKQVGFVPVPMATSRVKYLQQANPIDTASLLPISSPGSSIFRSIRKLPQASNLKRLSRTGTSSLAIQTSFSNQANLAPNPLGQSSPTPDLTSQFSQHLASSHFTSEHAHYWMIPGYGYVKFIDYAPLVFKLARENFGFTMDQVFESIGNGDCRISKSAGKSNSVFMETLDGRFLFKTLRGSEGENLRKFLPHYFEHIQANKGTLLPRYLGLFSFEPPQNHLFQVPESPTSANYDPIRAVLSKPFTVVMMANVMDTRLPVQVKFDFKGSEKGRKSLPDGADALEKVELSKLTLKELDFERLMEAGKIGLFDIGSTAKDGLLKELENDLELLKQFRFMDYSLLVGVQSFKTTSEAEHRESGSAESVNTDAYNCRGLRSSASKSNTVYFIGLIDILQKFNFSKWIERELHRQKNARLSVTGDSLGNPDTFVRRAISEQHISTANAALTRGTASHSHVNKARSTHTFTNSADSEPPIGVARGRSGSISSISGSSNGEMEVSVEEPGRYAERLLAYVQTVLV
ncbi:Phosphatidylinositol 4-phosphate 5-kinase type-1 alpha [Chytriomyces hyalinus]|nr:Phosphatidylinositol 4-phosphate 5-kinase type-1 alpha [Chytriomyces hyalinus]